MRSKRRARRRPLQAAIGMLVSAVLALGLVPLPAFAVAGEGGGAAATPGIAAGDAQGAGAPDGGTKQLAAAPLAAEPGGARLGAQEEGNLYAVFDSEDGSLTFIREAGTYADGEEVGTKAYYTGFEDAEYSFREQAPWLAHAGDIKKVDFQAAVAPRSCAYWFFNCWNLEEVQGADKLDASGVTDMGRMFFGCSSLSSLDVSRWDTSKVANMSCMFYYCPKLASLDVSKWDTSSVQKMQDMFNDCSSLTSLDLSGWNTSKVADMEDMFEGCSKLSSVRLGERFSFKGAASSSAGYAVLPDAPGSLGCEGRWINESATGAEGVEAGGLRDGYPDAANPNLAPGTYAWEGTTKAAVFDSEDGSLAFERVAGKYTDGQEVDTLTYYTGFEEKEYSDVLQPSWGAHAADIKKVDFQTTVAPKSCAFWFARCENLEEVLGAGRLTTSGVTDMNLMFADCSSLTSLDVSGWNTSKVTSMYNMFRSCSKLASLDVSRWDTSKVANMSCMFYNCPKLASLDVSGWSTSTVVKMEGVFYGCSELASLDVSKWDTSSAIYMGTMFYGCSSLSSLDVSKWDTSKVGDMGTMFNGCTSLSSVTLGESFSFKGADGIPSDLYAVLPDAPADEAHTGKWVNSSDPGAQGVTAADLRDNYPKAANPSYAPGTYVWEIIPKVAVFDSVDGSLTFKHEEGGYSDCQVVGTKTYYTGFEDKEYSDVLQPSWRAHAGDIKKVDFQAAVAPRSCAYWFYDCPELAEVLNADKLDVSGATSMDHMFSDCPSLSSLDVSKWNTSKVTNMASVFHNCPKLASLDVSGWDTSRVTNMGNAFSLCSSLSSLDVSKWVTSQVANMGSMFTSCRELASLDVSGWDTSQVANMGSIFSGCATLASLDVSKWVTSSATYMDCAFSGCSELASLDLSGWDTSKAEEMQNMFSGCSSLSSVRLGGSFSFKSAVSDPAKYAALPDAPDDTMHPGRWINSSEPGAVGVTAAELRDGYPDATDPSYAPGDYVWEVVPRVAVFDSTDGSLTFKRVAGTYNDGDTAGTLTYYTGFEGKAYSPGDRPSWLAHAGDITKVDFQTAVEPRSCAYWFAGCAKLTEVLGADKLDASGAASMEGMFEGCTSLSSLDASKWDISNVKSMRRMFSGCSSLAALDASKWDTSKVADMEGMFEGCSSLSSLDLSGWDTSDAESMYCMFDGCTGLSSVTLGGKFSFKARSGARYDAVLPDAPSGAGRTGRWVNSSATGAQGVTAAELRDGYPDASDPRFAPGAYAWEAAIDLSAAKVTAPGQTYTGVPLEPAPTVVLGGKTLRAGADYAVSYKNNVNAGTATVAVTGRGAYAGSASGAFGIAAADISKAEVKLAKTSYAYDGKAKKPKVKSVKLDGKKLKAGRDYKVSYKNNRKPGKAAATVVGKGNYKGSAKAIFSVKLAKAKLSTAADASGRRVVASWKAVAGAKAYRLQYRKAGGKWRTLGAKVTSRAVGGLKAGGLYEFRVRAVAGKQAGAWSAAAKRYLRPVKGVRAASTKAGAVTVRWKADPRASAGYEVSVSYSRNGGAAVTKTVAAGKTSATVGGLRPGEAAWVKVRPLRSSGGATYAGALTHAKRSVKVAG